MIKKVKKIGDELESGDVERILVQTATPEPVKKKVQGTKKKMNEEGH